ncbi:MAG: NAD(P)/FAD-dependent oxidoreductase [Deltaproteobacteria bacterium]|nr:NAD(P)/FAD-dependent oxidoreductase [Deltaproteobacteria bacterium]NND30397.1 NAD(P)/FAD-dependent oxidoreductase [Myxococcales bacterium]MBT8464985.1 NAD(P)/FAD-dependent oxidoreductase [Deltaproteobacteria bacterium]MBT8480800.1 NAD(P)/FAD-dependent oxidoreductase [Deltaproteobacteria bacterium]NNK09646.1 NAD(P)/FAD-dependent oxidoreductase [Myxococcales bacterium]
MSEAVDAVVIGAGVVGLACAHELLKRFDSVLVLEREAGPGREISSRNSGVVHAGIYYPRDSRKTRLCIEGNRRLYAWCEAHDVPHKHTGKLIVATSAADEERLRKIARHARDVGAGDLRLMTRDEASAEEPELRCELALHSPTSGVVDVHELIASLVHEIIEADGMVVYHTAVDSIEKIESGWLLQTIDSTGSETELVSRCVVNSAGLSALDVAESSGLAEAERPWRLYPCKGSYFALGSSAPETRNSLIYPLPSGGGLGVHITADISGARRAGPDAEFIDTIDYSVDESRVTRFAEAVARYLPAIRPEHLTPDYCGIRPKLVGPGGGFEDFVIRSPESQPGMVHLIGIESPGLTAALAIGARVSDLIP